MAKVRKFINFRRDSSVGEASRYKRNKRPETTVRVDKALLKHLDAFVQNSGKRVKTNGVVNQLVADFLFAETLKKIISAKEISFYFRSPFEYAIAESVLKKYFGKVGNDRAVTGKKAKLRSVNGRRVPFFGVLRVRIPGLGRPLALIRSLKIAFDHSVSVRCSEETIKESFERMTWKSDSHSVYKAPSRGTGKEKIAPVYVHKFSNWVVDVSGSTAQGNRKTESNQKQPAASEARVLRPGKVGLV